MALSKSETKKVIEGITAWAEHLIYPIPEASLKSQWEKQLNLQVSKLKKPVELSEKNMERIKSTTIDLYLQANRESVKLENENKIKAALERVQVSSEKISTVPEYLQFLSESTDRLIKNLKSYYHAFIEEDDNDYCQKLELSFQDKLVALSKTSKPFLFDSISSTVSVEINRLFEEFTKHLPALLLKTNKEKYTETNSFIETSTEELRKFVEGEFKVFPKHFFNYFSNILKNKVLECLSREHKNEYKSLDVELRNQLDTLLQKIKDQEITAFDSTLCSDLQREAILEVVISILPEDIEVSNPVLDNFLSLIHPPEGFSVKDHLRDNSHIENSVNKFLQNSQKNSRAFTILSLVLVFSNTYQYLAKNSRPIEQPYLPSFRQLIRLVVTELFQLRYTNIEGYKVKYNEWSFVLICEQQIALCLPDWLVKNKVVDLSKCIEEHYNPTGKNLLDEEDEEDEPTDKGFKEKVLGFFSGIINYFTPAQKIEEFRLETVKEVGSLPITILISGWLSEADELEEAWRNIIKFGLQGHTYALRWDSGSTGELIKSELFGPIGATIGVVLAPSVLKLAFLTQLFSTNPFQKRTKSAEFTGYVLADLINSKMLGNAPINLVGFSLGTRVIYYCLQKLNELGCKVHDVLLLGGAAPLDIRTWKKCKNAVKGRLINSYSKTDKVLSNLYSISQLEKAVGNWPIQVEGIENYDVTDEASGHLKYRGVLENVLKKIDYYIK